jgi:hypothetical protein
MDEPTMTALQREMQKLQESQQTTTANLQKFSDKIDQQLAVLSDSVSSLRNKLSGLSTPDTHVQKSSDFLSNVEHRHQFADLGRDRIPVLARDEVLDTVFSFVGIGDYKYVAGVCRNWRGRYITLCHKASKKPTAERLSTHIGKAFVTRSRLQLAFDDGLSVECLN